VDLAQLLLERFGFGCVLACGHLSKGCLQIAQDLGHVGVVFAMESGQLVEQIMPAGDGRMVKDLSTGDHLKSDAAEAQADLDATVAWVLALGGPGRGQLQEKKRGRGQFSS
jgi:hypothetical protein